MADTVIPSLLGGEVERFLPGDRITCTVKTSTGAATGGCLVALETTGDRVVDTAGAGSAKVLGVAMHDAAAGGIVTVATEGVWEIEAVGSISAGDRVKAAAGGKVSSATVDVTSTPTETTIEAALNLVAGIVGIALDDVTNGQMCPVKLTL